MSLLIISAMMMSNTQSSIKIDLPKPELKQNNTLNTIHKRRSQRRFSPKMLTKNQISDLLYAAYGTKVNGLTSASKTVPSAGATYPLEIYLVVGSGGIEGIREGVYFYSDTDNSLMLVKEGDLRNQIMEASLGQEFILEAPVSIVITAKYSRTTGRYGQRGQRYVDMEAGHSCENIYLVTTQLELATVEVGAFSDMEVKRILNLKKDSQPLAIMPIGYPK